MDDTLKRARAALDARFAKMRPNRSMSPPPRGWIRAIRDALGMSGKQLAARMGVTQQSLSEIEKAEADERIRLDTLRRAADALNCDLIYALVPRDGLSDRVAARARLIALRQLAPISHSMEIEDQGVRDDDMEARIAKFVANTLRDRDLWNDGSDR